MPNRTPPTDGVIQREMITRGGFNCAGCGQRVSPDDVVLTLLATLCPRCASLGDKEYAELEPKWASWFTGLVDGEGCFYIGNDGCQFLINMRADDDELLKMIRDVLGFGRIHYVRDTSTAYAIRRPACRFEVSRKQDCIQITHIFDRFPLRSRKARDFEVWREAVIAHQAGARPSSLAIYKARLSEVRKYRDDRSVPA